jgi:hypothetical protein
LKGRLVRCRACREELSWDNAARKVADELRRTTQGRTNEDTDDRRCYYRTRDEIFDRVFNTNKRDYEVLWITTK